MSGSNLCCDNMSRHFDFVKIMILQTITIVEYNAKSELKMAKNYFKSSRSIRENTLKPKTCMRNINKDKILMQS